MAATSSRLRPASSRRGFTLLELMVVVVIIGIIAALAVPSMRIATFDRHAYQDAGAVMQLFREARLRSVARGGAILMTISSNGSTDRGTFMLYDGVQQDPSGTYSMPFPSCKAPPAPWNPGGQGTLLVDGVNLNGQPEVDADIQTQVYTWDFAGSGNPSSQLNKLYVCFTPVGRSYVNSSANFSGLPTTSVVEVRVLRGVANGLPGAVTRSVLVAPNGMPRLFSKVL